MNDLADPRLRIRFNLTATGCWEWTGARAGNGYGRISWKNHVERVHRVAAHLALGYDLTSDLAVLHRCDNPPCFNPAHLFIGTLSDNTQDMIAKGRCRSGNKPHSHCAKGHPLEGDNLRIISGDRFCRTCFNARQRAYYHRRKAIDPVFAARKHVRTSEITDLAAALGIEVDG